MNKKLGIIIGVVLVIVVVITAVFLLKGNKEKPDVDNSQNTVADNDGNAGGIIIDNERDKNSPIIPPDVDDSVVVEIEDIVVPNEYPELDWDEPPVLTYYNEKADTNDNGHVDKAEWEVWVENHPEDLNQDMVITEEEKDKYDKMIGGGNLTIDDIRDMANPTVVPDTEDPNTIIDPILAPSEEEQAAEDAKNKADNEAAGQGLAGLKQWGEQHKGVGNGFYEDLPEGVIVDENGNVTDPSVRVKSE